MDDVLQKQGGRVLDANSLKLGIECLKQTKRKRREETAARPRVLDGGAVVVYVGACSSKARETGEEEGKTQPRRPVLNRSRGTK